MVFHKRLIYNESDKGEWVYNHVYTLIKEIAKAPSTYKEYSEKTVKEVVKEIEKGEIYWKRDPDEPLVDAYYTVVQNHTMDEESKAISRIIREFDESDLAKRGIKIESNQQLLVYDIYNELQIWQDKNQNGVVDDGELMTLSEAGIASINLAYENIDVRDESGNGHSQRGTYTKTDGTTSTVEDVWFEKGAANTVVSDTIDKNVLEETDEIAGLPDIQGKRNQYSLYQAGVYLEEAAEMLVA